ncbi:MAG: hypothetical protein HYR85_09175 [Planctomycetes bacterium]|nr:hypothetical protein [Planctomycetota bacterium]MBI3846964.1 hypothetical protein [Planctomycetota bacterium]
MRLRCAICFVVGIACALLSADSSAQGVLVPITDRRDHVFDGSRGLLYVTTAHGSVERFDLATQALLAPLSGVGTSLRAVDVTADGRSLYVTDDATTGTQSFIRKVDLGTRLTTTIAYPINRDPRLGEAGSWDIAIGSNGKAFVSTQGLGEVALRELDLSSDVVGIRRDIPGLFFPTTDGMADIERSADRRRMLVDECRGGVLFEYDAVRDVFENAIDFSACWNGADAMSRDGREWALTAGAGAVDSHIQTIGPLGGGVAFDPTRDVLYGVDPFTDEIVAIDFGASARRELFRIAVGEDVDVSRHFDDGVMSVSADGRWLALSTPAGIRVFDLSQVAACRAGNVNAGAGAVTDVLRIGASTGDAYRVVRLIGGTRFPIVLDAAPAGPRPARYALWIWRGEASRSIPLVVGGATLGCLVGPTPLQRGQRPQPVLCIRGAGVPASACRGAREPFASPHPIAPFTIPIPLGASAGFSFTLQCVIEDAGSANSRHVSVTNAIILRFI